MRCVWSVWLLSLFLQESCGGMSIGVAKPIGRLYYLYMTIQVWTLVVPFAVVLMFGLLVAVVELSGRNR
jgi:hypothetical protein